MSDALFEGYDPPVLEKVDETLSAGRRLTLRQKTFVANGVHPLTRGPLHPEASRGAPDGNGFTCGSCVFREPSSGHSWPKCLLPGPFRKVKMPDGSVRERPTYPRVTRGAASDVRAWWPACPEWEAKPGG